MSTASVTEITASGLTDKQERFAHEYLIDQNAGAACLRAVFATQRTTRSAPAEVTTSQPNM